MDRRELPDGLVRFTLGDLEVLVLDLELPEAPLPELTPSEREVATLVADGLSNGEIAEAREVSERTVANQIRSIFQKLGVCSRWDLALLMTRRALEPVVDAPTVLVRRDPPSRSYSGIYNSPTSAAVLRASYERHGVDFEAACARRRAAPEPDGSLAREDYCALFDELAAELGEPELGVRLPRSVPIGALGMLEWLGMSAPTLGDAMAIVSTHGDLLHPGARRETRVRGDELRVEYSVDGLSMPRVVLDWSMVCLLERIRSGAPEVEPIELQVQYDRPRGGVVEALVGCPVRFGAETNALVLPREQAEMRLPTSDPETFERLRAIADWRLDAARSSVVGQLRAAVTGVLERDAVATPREVARALGVPMNALGRELARPDLPMASRGLSFADVVSLCRAERVIGALEGRGVDARHVGIVLSALAER